MVILHIAQLYNKQFSGVDIVVPKHVIYQQRIEKVALINLSGMVIDGVDNQLFVDEKFNIDELPVPFNKPDVVVFHEVYRIGFLRIAKQLKKRGVSYIIVPHACLTNHALKIKKLKKFVGNIILFNKFIKNAKAIHCLSEYEKIETNFNVSKFVCANGIDLPPIVKREFDLEYLRFVYVGRLHIYHKGLDILIDAIAKIKEFLIENNTRFEIYGPDIYKSKYILEKRIAKNHLENVITIKESVYGDEKIKVLLSSNIFIQTSRLEGMPMSILEALSLSMPCVVTEGTTLDKIIVQYNAGWAAKVDSESVAESIKKAVLEKDNLAAMSINARKLVEDNFSWEEIARKTIEEYKNMLGEKVC